jgi:hypothetical protein
MMVKYMDLGINQSRFQTQLIKHMTLVKYLLWHKKNRLISIF